ncbi:MULTISPECIES: sorbosone dehydrogenase family protein [unclassified Cupriavidus]|uniref:PQQ-dependent sugar dehydrogenase n=1 Tax=unclassified Cupriavidus TaxID=2640874 RepID=UPI001C007931|nr:MULTISPECIES: sorbosone dehydrogenase family protein [unclassified Cupriavidus]MCA3186742.1 sorbosone dehydrogenase family protein [Cupriavidus sp.]MCA3189622.1 sorbosone dehydrogenase family protein [Cupriavidus sp.]MCA3195740.1 sorbosone dehydrogenase family protein [Cupriavidus sp.]MCA3203898.1 sorbosone dehydrogenase family protein [Cupriavidus sp.]MCA3206142.1 sorbosone dehydrogenase family protein [Cupriavidus sp.]
MREYRPFLIYPVASLFAIVAVTLLVGCGESAKLPETAGIGPTPQLPAPQKSMIPTIHIAPAEGWKDGKMPVAADGLRVAAFADKLDHPRWVYVLPNGDVLVAETNAPPKPDDNKGIRGWVQKKTQERAGAATPSANRITLLRDTNGDGVADQRSVFLQNLNSPFGMVLVGNDFYVADTDAVLRFPYTPGQPTITAPAQKLVDLPAGPINHHWTKNIIASPDGSKLYVTVGSNSNAGENGIEKEAGRAAIWEVDRQTGQHRIFASGLRNPNGMAWEPTTKALWTSVNERDEIGSDLVPDYITSVRDGGFYGWPFSYYGQHVDDRVKPAAPDMVAKAIVPDYAVGAHTASLGMTGASGNSLLPQFHDGMFVSQHGSWNRKPLAGYKVIFVPFDQGKPRGAPFDVLTGFVDQDGKAQGRPVGVAVDKTGGLLVADDVGNVVWRVSGAR